MHFVRFYHRLASVSTPISIHQFQFVKTYQRVMRVARTRPASPVSTFVLGFLGLVRLAPSPPRGRGEANWEPSAQVNSIGASGHCASLAGRPGCPRCSCPFSKLLARARLCHGRASRRWGRSRRRRTCARSSVSHFVVRSWQLPQSAVGDVCPTFPFIREAANCAGRNVATVEAVGSTALFCAVVSPETR